MTWDATLKVTDTPTGNSLYWLSWNYEPEENILKHTREELNKAMSEKLRNANTKATRTICLKTYKLLTWSQGPIGEGR